MDLNFLYSQHQLSLMRAGATPSRLARTKYFAAAGAFANRILAYQHSIGANASVGWLRSRETPDWSAANPMTI
jgi:hypothetical protein